MSKRRAVVGAAVLALGVGGGCTKDEPPPPMVERPYEPMPLIPPTLPPKTESPPTNAETLAQAVGSFAPTMRDTMNTADPGAAGFAVVWANMNYPWSQMQALPETTFGKVKKDVALERGKRLCTSGTIVEIEAIARSPGQIHEGRMMTGNLDVVSFLAVGSTGSLVEKQSARFCGVVTGKHSYVNSAGGMTHSVYVVGMFDLPENRKPTSSAGAPAKGARPSTL